MRHWVGLFVVALVAAGCSGKDDNTGDTGLAGNGGGLPGDNGAPGGGGPGGGGPGGADDTGTTGDAGGPGGGPGGGADDTGTSGGPGGGTGGDCDVEIDDTIPAHGASDAYYRGDIVFELSDPDPTASISVGGVSGVSVLSDDQETVTFTPSAPLNPSTDYTATLDYCGGSPAISFSTSSLGSSPVTSLDEGATYALDFTSGRWVEPAGVGSILEAYLEASMLLSVVNVSGASLDMRFGLGLEEDPEQQDFCQTTTELRGLDYSDAPYFQLGPADLELSIGGVELEFLDFMLSGTFASDYSYIGGAVFAGSIDTRPLGELLLGEDDPDAVCDLMVGFGVSCVECPGGGDYCLSVVIQDLVAEEIRDELERVGQADCHDECPDSYDNPDCDL